MTVQNRHIRALRPFLIGENPRPNGEWDMFCPLHEDQKRSASLNVLSGEWYCFAGCGGGRVVDLIRQRSNWVDPSAASTNGHAGVSGAPNGGGSHELASEGKVAGWHSALMANEGTLDELLSARGLYTDTIIKYQIGWHPDKKVFTVPIRGFEDELWNVRFYDLRPRNERRKIWSIGGMRSTELYPVEQLSNDRVIVCEGEWDALVTIQNGYPAITRTAAARVWMSGWSEFFKDKVVYLAHDSDTTGQSANRRVGRALRHLAADIRVVRLPYPIVEKHGQDLSDFWLEHDRSDFEQMLAEAQPFLKTEKSDEPEVITVLDSFDAQRVSEPVKLQVTIKGKKDPGYSVPSKARLTCSRDAGAKCNVCPLNPAGGEAVVEIAPSNPLVLGLMDASAKQASELIRQEYGALQCNRLTIEMEEHQSVEVLFARPSIDHSDGTQARDYKNVKITSTGRHDTLPNNTVVATGALYPNPRDHRNEFLSWRVDQQETSVDRFELTPEAIKQMERFKPRAGQRPLSKLAEISKEFATHVTRITGRPEMHALMDLTFHSALSFKFGGQVVHRGWLESLVVGDTRTGKSEAAEQLVRHFRAGEVVGGEASTLAGLVGGLQQIGGKDWAVTWGVIPLNDRRLVVIDELSGLHPEEIAKMSDVRASGMARLTKIQQEVTFARTRLLWLGNPRHGGMDQFTYGVDALRPLIGNPEDIARFDLAMAVSLGDVPAEVINRPAKADRPLRYTSEACNTLLMWVWTRQADQVTFTQGAENAIYKAANEMGSRYTEEPPLVQAANIRIKVARVAVALAARTFSTDDSHEKIIINQDHVRDAVKFMDMLYEMPSFGYAERSRERIRDIADAKENKTRIKKYLHERRGLAKFLRSVGRFKRQDVEEIMNLSRDEANAMINTLWEARMVRKDDQFIRVEPTLHELLREVKF